MQSLYIYQNKEKINATLFEDKDVLFTTNNVCIGRGGLISSKEKKEGDGCTPTGIYNILGTFGLDLNRNIEEIKSPLIKGISHLQISGPNQCFWVDDPKSSYYNTMQWDRRLENELIFNNKWDSAEDLYNEVYKYAFILDYNKYCIPGKGSAIFIHVARKNMSPTEGCVAFIEEEFKDLISKMKKDVKVCIANLN